MHKVVLDILQLHILNFNLAVFYPMPDYVPLYTTKSDMPSMPKILGMRSLSKGSETHSRLSNIHDAGLHRSLNVVLRKVDPDLDTHLTLDVGRLLIHRRANRLLNSPIRTHSLAPATATDSERVITYGPEVHRITFTFRL